MQRRESVGGGPAVTEEGLPLMGQHAFVPLTSCVAPAMGLAQGSQ